MTELEAVAQAIHSSAMAQAWANYGGLDSVVTPMVYSYDDPAGQKPSMLERYQAHVNMRVDFYLARSAQLGHVCPSRGYLVDLVRGGAERLIEDVL